MNRLDERGLWGDERPEAGAGVGEPVRIVYVDRWFYSRSGERGVGKPMPDGTLALSSLAPPEWQALTVAEFMEWRERRRRLRPE